MSVKHEYTVEAYPSV